ncbi:unnamed protein product [Ranitomeya imitator]|uniref:Calponin-homology (CH) domain-containing protein n=1 Tax=Ranitomeya imitator TaxID=111125 RepID=A0ABN9LB68_9NEOB|nr:unnamed protein product [Ranitomeya imitator]
MDSCYNLDMSSGDIDNGVLKIVEQAYSTIAESVFCKFTFQGCLRPKSDLRSLLHVPKIGAHWSTHSVFIRPQRNLEAIDPQFTIRRKMEQMREEKELVDSLRENIEMRLKICLPEDLGFALMDGVVLCHLVNQIRPRSVGSIHVPSPAVPKLSMAKCRRNVENFLEACRKMGVPEAKTSWKRRRMVSSPSNQNLSATKQPLLQSQKHQPRPGTEAKHLVDTTQGQKKNDASTLEKLPPQQKTN